MSQFSSNNSSAEHEYDDSDDEHGEENDSMERNDHPMM